MSGAGEQLQQAVIAALERVDGLGVYPGPPLQAAVPYAMVDAGLENDWSHKSGQGRDVRVAVTIRDKGQRPDRIQRLATEAEAAIETLQREIGPSAGDRRWQLVTMQLARKRVVADGQGGWGAALEYKARMLTA